MTLRRLLAVSHEGGVGGAQIVLEDLQRWIRANTDVEVRTVMLTPGAMWNRFAAHGPVEVLGEEPASGDPRRLLDHHRDVDLVLLNSLGSLAALPFLPRGVPVVSHLHEMHVACRNWTNTYGRRPLTDGPDAWVAASRPVAEMLTGEFGVTPSRVMVHPSFIDVDRLLSRRVDDRELHRRREALGIHPEAAVVMGSGTIDWRKGTEFFVQLAAAIRRSVPDPVHFVWVGGRHAGVEWEQMRSDIEHAGVTDLTVTGTVDDPVPLHQLADVFVLTSHEDPFPLVCLEHAALGHPVVAFDSGGIVDVLREAGPEAAAGVVDHLDTAAMAERVRTLIYDDEQRRRAGEQLAARVASTYDVSVRAPALVEDLRRLTLPATTTNGSR